MKRRMRLILYVAIPVLLIMALYLCMLVNTSPLIEYARDVMSGNVMTSETTGFPIDKYNLSDHFPNADISVNITRVFVLHNFADGYLWVKYSCEGRDEKGNLLTASDGVFSKWKIHKENGLWAIIAIIENP